MSEAGHKDNKIKSKTPIHPPPFVYPKLPQFVTVGPHGPVPQNGQVVYIPQFEWTSGTNAVNATMAPLPSALLANPFSAPVFSQSQSEAKLTEQIIELQRKLAEERQKQKESDKKFQIQMQDQQKLIIKLEAQLAAGQVVTDTGCEKTILNEEIKDLKTMYAELIKKYNYLYSIYETQLKCLHYDYVSIYGMQKPSKLP
jgi:hypothetical protein